jgi:sulfide:quinone oxidoreductase
MAATISIASENEAMHGLLQDVEGGYTKRIAFVVPPGITWALPLYELALMTAERAYGLNLEVQLTIVTPEAEPLAVFGPAASESVVKILADAGIAVVPNSHVRRVDHGEVIASPGDVIVRADRVVALPRLEGPGVRGLPADAHGFLPVDARGRLTGTDDVFAAGDGTTFAIKQGGIAAQQADAVARTIAGRAGAELTARPFRPVLRAKLLAGSQAKYLRQAVAGGAGDGASTFSDHTLWWPPTKVAAPYLSPYLERLDTGTGAAPSPSGPPAPGIAPPVVHGQGDPSGGIELLSR